MHSLWLRVLLFAGVLLFSMSCTTLGYYSQSVSGQLGVMARRKPVYELINDLGTNRQLKQRLVMVQSMRRFASDTLVLPDNSSYTLYADIERPYVVWNVFAAPPFAMTTKTWCFPIVGCVAYRGYFAEEDARRFGDSLEQEGYDVYIGGAVAYSTLGWFDDPILSTFISLSKPDTAALA